MKNTLHFKTLLFAAFSFLFNFIFAQSYSSGDIQLNLSYFNNHDQNSCSSMSVAQYDITIYNSQLGDTFKINEPGIWGYNLFTTVNTTGSNPWIISSFSDIGAFYSDQSLNNQPGYASFFWGERKCILTHFNGNQQTQDTLHNVYPNDGLYVDNPCLYSIVSGKAYFDENANCLFDNNDIPLNSVNISATSNVSGGSAYTNGNGDYNLTLQETNMTSYTVALPSNYQFIFQSTACSPVSYTSTTLPQTGFDFSLQCEEIDLYARSNGPGRALPNDPFNIFASVGNIGCTPSSGQLKLKLDPRVIYSAADSYQPANTIIPSSTGDTLVWNFTNLSSLSNGAYWNAFISRIRVTPLTTVTIGDTLHFSYWSTIPAQDINYSNNQGTFSVEIVAAYDPNFKEVSPKGIEANGYIPENTEDLTYTIHFQNSGTAPATNIYVIDTLDSSIDPASLHIELTSHTMNPEWLAPNVVKFTFNAIYLPYEAVNEAGSHGSFTFNVRLLPGLSLGTEIKNRGFIYFDYNPPIITNYTINTLATLPSVQTGGISGLTFTSVNLSGEITEEGGAPIIQKGFCMSNTPAPTLLNTVILNTESSSILSNAVSSLSESTIYYVRAFATNAMGTTYGDEVSFETGSTASLFPANYLTEKFSVYPNPVQNVLTLQSTLLLKAAKIIGTDGKIIGEYDLSDGGLKIDVSNLLSGTYFVEIESYLGYFNRITFVKR